MICCVNCGICVSSVESSEERIQEVRVISLTNLLCTFQQGKAETSHQFYSPAWSWITLCWQHCKKRAPLDPSDDSTFKSNRRSVCFPLCCSTSHRLFICPLKRSFSSCWHLLRWHSEGRLLAACRFHQAGTSQRIKLRYRNPRKSASATAWLWSLCLVYFTFNKY